MKRKISISHISALTFLITVFLAVSGHAQNQPDIPKPRGPVDLSDTSNLIIFIVIPLIILIVYLVYRKRIKKVREEREDRIKEENEKRLNKE